jgi:hypothetical protein
VSDGRPSSSVPSSTSPYIPSRCHLTTDQSTPIGMLIFCWIVLVDRPVKSRRSLGSSKVYEKSFDTSRLGAEGEGERLAILWSVDVDLLSSSRVGVA